MYVVRIVKQVVLLRMQSLVVWECFILNVASYKPEYSQDDKENAKSRYVKNKNFRDNRSIKNSVHYAL